MASIAPFIACFFLGFVALVTSGYAGFHLLPPWLAVHVLRLRTKFHGPAFDANSYGPEHVLLQRLKNIDVAREPATAHSLHAAVGNMLRISDGQMKQAVHHFEAARDAAARTDDLDTLMISHLDLAEAYIEEGRPLDAQRETVAASGVLANHFEEHRSRLNRARGLAQFELGWTEKALQYFYEAAETATQTVDVVRASCAVAMAHACLGRADKSLHPLREALNLLQSARKANFRGGSMPTDVYNTLAGEVHLRMAEAFHLARSPGHEYNGDFAMAHYKKALYLQQSPIAKAKQLPKIKRGIAWLEKGAGPDLHCPKRPQAPWNAPTPSHSVTDAAFTARISLLMEEEKYNVVESELKTILRAHTRPYKKLEAAIALNMLGSLYRKQAKHAKAARQFAQALHASMACRGAQSTEAQTAFEGLKDVKDKLSPADARVAAAEIEWYFDVSMAPRKLAGDVEKPVEHTSPKGDLTAAVVEVF